MPDPHLSSAGRFDTVLELPSDRETLIRRTFEAPAELVFDAWTIPDQVRRWYGLAELDMTVCEIDLRVGGRWRWVQESPDGYEVAFSGVYRHIDRARRLAFTEVFEPMPEAGFDVEMTFDEVEGHTTVTTVMTYQSRQHRDGHLESGMEEGTGAVHLRLDELFAALQAEH